MKNSGVYEAECKCGVSYVGQTGRSIETRLKEHFSRPKDSRIGEHIEKTGHTREDCKIKLMHNENNFGKRIILEHIEITKKMQQKKQKIREYKNYLTNNLHFLDKFYETVLL